MRKLYLIFLSASLIRIFPATSLFKNFTTIVGSFFILVAGMVSAAQLNIVPRLPTILIANQPYKILL